MDFLFHSTQGPRVIEKKVGNNGGAVHLEKVLPTRHSSNKHSRHNPASTGSGFGFRVSGFGFRVSGFGFQVSGLAIAMLGGPGF